MAYNKFITKDNRILLDLTDATDIPSGKLEKGYIAYDRHGDRIVGTGEYQLQEKTITENSEVLADEGYYGLSKVNVEVPMPSGNLDIIENGEYDISNYEKVTIDVSGLSVNGVIEEYKVAAGANINAGDFVEFVNRFGGGTFSNKSVTYSAAHKLSYNKILVVYGENGAAAKAVVISIDNNTINVGNAYTFRNTPSGGNLFEVYAAVLNKNRAVVTCTTMSSGGSMSSSLAVLNISNDGVISDSGASFSLGGNSYVITPINDSTIFITYNNSGTSVGKCLQIIDTASISQTNVTLPSNFAISGYQTAKLTDNTMAIAAHSNATTDNKVCLWCININGTSASFGEKYIPEVKAQSSSYTIVALSTREIMFIYATNPSSGTGATCAEIYELTDGVFSKKGTTLTISAAYWSRISAAKINDNTIILTGSTSTSPNKGVAVILTVEDDTISMGSIKTFDESNTSYTNVLPLSSTDVFTVYNNGTGKYGTLSVSGNTISSNNEIIGTYVKSATSRLYNVGIAKTSGVGGDTVEVYCVNK